jgi:hypothetical protein
MLLLEKGTETEQECAASALAALAYDDEVGEVIGKEGAIQHLFALLASGDASAQEKAAQAFINLTDKVPPFSLLPSSFVFLFPKG